ncbi:MAG TPA: hypothetical protein VKU38_06520, partial [Ktedonobacteraceae bacterium]|nr:hypothetical protein [Ktedonobacteraceae bacterium]
LRDVGDKISASLRSDVEGKISAVRDALSSNNTSQLQPAMDDLERTMQRVGQEIYSQAGAASSPGSGPSSAGSTPDDDSGTIEGEYREV